MINLNKVKQLKEESLNAEQVNDAYKTQDDKNNAIVSVNNDEANTPFTDRILLRPSLRERKSDPLNKSTEVPLIKQVVKVRPDQGISRHQIHAQTSDSNVRGNSQFRDRSHLAQQHGKLEHLVRDSLSSLTRILDRPDRGSIPTISHTQISIGDTINNLRSTSLNPSLTNLNDSKTASGIQFSRGVKRRTSANRHNFQYLNKQNNNTNTSVIIEENENQNVPAQIQNADGEEIIVRQEKTKENNNICTPFQTPALKQTNDDSVIVIKSDEAQTKTKQNIVEAPIISAFDEKENGKVVVILQKWWQLKKVNLATKKRLRALGKFRSNLLAVYQGWYIRQKVLKSKTLKTLLKDIATLLKKERNQKQTSIKQQQRKKLKQKISSLLDKMKNLMPDRPKQLLPSENEKYKYTRPEPIPKQEPLVEEENVQERDNLQLNKIDEKEEDDVLTQQLQENAVEPQQLDSAQIEEKEEQQQTQTFDIEETQRASNIPLPSMPPQAALKPQFIRSPSLDKNDIENVSEQANESANSMVLKNRSSSQQNNSIKPRLSSKIPQLRQTQLLEQKQKERSSFAPNTQQISNDIMQCDLSDSSPPFAQQSAKRSQPFVPPLKIQTHQTEQQNYEAKQQHQTYQNETTIESQQMSPISGKLSESRMISNRDMITPELIESEFFETSNNILNSDLTKSLIANQSINTTNNQQQEKVLKKQKSRNQNQATNNQDTSSSQPANQQTNEPNKPKRQSYKEVQSKVNVWKKQPSTNSEKQDKTNKASNSNSNNINKKKNLNLSNVNSSQHKAEYPGLVKKISSLMSELDSAKTTDREFYDQKRVQLERFIIDLRRDFDLICLDKQTQNSYRSSNHNFN